MATPFETFVNRELPRRPALLTVAIAAYDDDPNGGGAPAILLGSPAGTLYLQETPETLWRKTTTGTWVENEGGGGGGESPIASESAITVTIDPAATTPEPPAGTVFANQTQVDDYLAAAGQTAFKHTQDYTKTLPFVIQHAITVTHVIGNHRPRYGGTSNYSIFFDRMVVASGSITLGGDANTNNWTVLHAGGTVRTNQVAGSGDPWMTVDPGTFPSDDTLNGKFAVCSNGFMGLIWKHTDSQLWVCPRLSPAPVNNVTTVSVREPATYLQNTLDGITPANTNYMCRMTSTLGSGGGVVTLQNMTIHDYGCGLPLVFYNGKWNVYTVIHDKNATPSVPANGYAVRTSGKDGYVNYYNYGMIAPSQFGLAADRAEGPINVNEGMLAYFNRCFIQGGDEGVTVTGLCIVYDSVLRGVGRFADSINVSGQGSLRCQYQAGYYGVYPSIWDVDGVSGYGAIGLYSSKASIVYLGPCRIGNITGPYCIKLGPKAQFDQAVASPVLDGGGNLGVAWLVEGPRATLVLPTQTTLTGVGGDVKFGSDDSVWTYAEITAASPIVDSRLNIVER